MGVSKNSGTPNHPFLIGFSSINHPFWGTPILGNTHMFKMDDLHMLGKFTRLVCQQAPCENRLILLTFSCLKTFDLQIPIEDPQDTVDMFHFQPSNYSVT